LSFGENYRNYQNLPGQICRIEKNQIMLSPYFIFEVDKLLHDESFKILNINHIFNISLTMSQQTQSDIFHTKMLLNALWCQITWYVIFWNIAPKQILQ
jgi:hypothetical protein